MFSYCSVVLTFLFVSFALSDSAMEMVVLAIGMLFILVVITGMRLQELRIGGDTVQIAVDEVLDIRLDTPFNS